MPSAATVLHLIFNSVGQINVIFYISQDSPAPWILLLVLAVPTSPLTPYTWQLPKLVPCRCPWQRSSISNLICSVISATRIITRQYQLHCIFAIYLHHVSTSYNTFPSTLLLILVSLMYRSGAYLCFGLCTGLFMNHVINVVGDALLAKRYYAVYFHIKLQYFLRQYCLFELN